MADRFENRDNLAGPALHAAGVTPADGADMTISSRGLYVGGAGDLKVTMEGGETVTFPGVVAGTLLPIRVRRVFATGTTATSILSLF